MAKSAMIMEDYIGLENEQIGQQTCKVIEAFNCRNITVQFNDENKTIVYKQTCYNFNHGKIKNPAIFPPRDKPLKDQIGLKIQQNNGQEAELIEYLGNNQVLIKFPDGKTRTCGSHAFRYGEVAHPDHAKFMGKPEERLHLKTITNDGFVIEITAYRSAGDIDITFLIDGTVVKASYVQFQRANIKHPNFPTNHSISFQEFAIGYYLYKLGFVKIRQSQWINRGFGQFELDFYHEGKNIAIEYDGSIHYKPDAIARDMRKNKKCKDFGISLYRLREHTLPELTDGQSTNYVLKKENQLERRLNNCKVELEEILTINNIPFESGMIDFVRDQKLLLDEYNKNTINYYKNLHENETMYSEKHKQELKILEYYSCDNVTVLFTRDNVVYYNAKYNCFKKDNLAHPNTAKKNHRKNRLGKSFPQNNGHVCKIIEYYDYDHVTIEWEDGSVRENVCFANIKKGVVGYTSRKSANKR